MNATLPVTVSQFQDILRRACGQDTTADIEHWTPTNPLLGHCAVASVIAQELFGGKLLRASLANTPFAYGGSHYINEFVDGTRVDFTALQFGSVYPVDLEYAERTRQYVLYGPPDAKPEVRTLYDKTRERYKTLMLRTASMVTKNKLFVDRAYVACFTEALESPCQKMRFGCVITKNGAVVYKGFNKTIEPLAVFCDPTCIRFQIQSRTESMLGACGHAEELGLWTLINRGIDLRECELYIAGVFMNGMPWIKGKAEHTCLRCATQMYHAGLRAVYVPVDYDWERLTVEKALVTAREYAEKSRSKEQA